MEPSHPRDQWADLEANSHLPEIQERIRRAIRAGKVRVVPAPGGIRIIPCAEPDSKDLAAPSLPDANAATVE